MDFDKFRRIYTLAEEREYVLTLLADSEKNDRSICFEWLARIATQLCSLNPKPFELVDEKDQSSLISISSMREQNLPSQRYHRRGWRYEGFSTRLL